MATVAQRMVRPRLPDQLSGTPRAHAIDRWIFVAMAAWFIAITLTGFIPDSIAKVAAVQAGQRPPFPLVLHVHAVLMGSFLALLLAQTLLMATGRSAFHRQLGMAAFVIAPAIVIVGLILVPTMFYQTWDALQTASGAQADKLRTSLADRENIMLVQMRLGLLFPLFLGIGLQARQRDAGLHKRMMILATAMALPNAIDRIHWLPMTYPASFATVDLWALVAVLPMFAWDVMRNRRVHEAYVIWLAVNLPFAVIVHGLWGTDWWHLSAQHLMGA